MTVTLVSQVTERAWTGNRSALVLRSVDKFVELLSRSDGHTYQPITSWTRVNIASQHVRGLSTFFLLQVCIWRSLEVVAQWKLRGQPSHIRFPHCFLHL